MQMLKNKSKHNMREQMRIKSHHNKIQIPVPRPAQPLEPESDTDVEEETLSLPEFCFMEFAGLEGFDKESCSWTPINCDEYEYEYPSSFDGDAPQSEFDQHVRFNKNTNHNNNNSKVSAKKTTSGPCNVDHHRRRGRNSTFHLPHIPGTKRASPSVQNHRGGLIYDEQPLKINSSNFHINNLKSNNGDDTEEESLQRKLDRIRIFGGPRNCNSRLYKDRQSSISLPPLHGNLRRSTSLPCQGNEMDQQSKGRKTFLDLHKKSIRMYRDYHQNASLNNNQKAPWQGPNSKGIYSTNSCTEKNNSRFHCEFLSSDNGKSHGKRYGGLGIVTCHNASNNSRSGRKESGRKESGNFPRTYKTNKSVNNNNNNSSSSSNIFNMSGKILFPPCKPGPFLKASKTKHGKGMKSRHD